MKEAGEYKNRILGLKKKIAIIQVNQTVECSLQKSKIKCPSIYENLQLCLRFAPRVTKVFLSIIKNCQQQKKNGLEVVKLNSRVSKGNLRFNKIMMNRSFEQKDLAKFDLCF